ncbi:cutinase family protein [Nocardia transvalensis]|uniref:cutinase family protein n=1 Tax=Nocardia transvalensis TaxID=37333 RepID=UPI001894A0D6|nr:cutinase family protein [Nocardia transvalensis]MBF6327860.1 cutinase family protein [Nocardia transvalensis]
MGDRKVLLPEKWRTAWVFGSVLLLAGVLYPAQPARAQGCAAVDVVVARGTQEPGYLGSEVGDPLFAMLRDRLPMSASAYRVNYPADLTNAYSMGMGSADLVAHVAGRAAACPGQRFVLVGYSQGAAVVHTALGTGATEGVPGAVRMDGDLAARVAVVLLFGDPLRLIGWTVPDAYLWRTGNYCTPGDPVCAGGTNPASHVAYGDSFVGAANFAADHL